MKTLMVKSSAYQRLLAHKGIGTSNISEFAAAGRVRYNYLRQNGLLHTLSKAQIAALTKSCYVDEWMALLLDTAREEVEDAEEKPGFFDNPIAYFWYYMTGKDKCKFDPSIFERMSDEPLLFLLCLNEFDGNCGDLRDEAQTTVDSRFMSSVTHNDLDHVIENFCLGRSVPILGRSKDWIKWNKDSFDIDIEIEPMLFAGCVKHAQLKGWQFTKTSWVEDFVLDGKLPDVSKMGELYVACDDLFDIIIAASLHTSGFDVFDARTGLRLDVLSGYFGIFSFHAGDLNYATATPFTNSAGFNYSLIKKNVPEFIKTQIECTSEAINGDKVVTLTEAYFE